MKFTDETMPIDLDQQDHEKFVLENNAEKNRKETLIKEALDHATISGADEFQQEGDEELEKQKKEEAKKKGGSKSLSKSKTKKKNSVPKDESAEEENFPEDLVEESLIQSAGSTLPKGRSYIDEEGKHVEDTSSPYREYHQQISSAFNRKDMLSGFIEGFELNSVSMPRAFLYCGDIKVIIPLSHLELPIPEARLNDPIEARLAVNAILGAKIFYMVLDIDFPNRVAVGSRKYANNRRRNAHVNYHDGNNVYKIRPGVLCTAQVIHISQRFARVDIYGFETTIGISHISNLWVNDIREVLDVGAEIMVEIAEVQRDETTGDATAIEASMRLAEQENTISIEDNQTYTGTVSGFSPVAYFVRVSGVGKDVRCPISKCFTGKLIEVGDYVKFFVDSYRDNEPSGSIVKILKKTDKSLQNY